jgi:hypothetical protein
MKKSIILLISALVFTLLLIVFSFIFMKVYFSKHNLITYSDIEIIKNEEWKHNNNKKYIDEMVRKEFSVSSFKEIVISDNFLVTISQGESFSVHAEALHKDLEMIEVEVRSEVLYIQSSTHQQKMTANIYIEFPAIQSIEISSGVDLNTVGKLQLKEFNFTASSASIARINGHFDNIRCTVDSGSLLELTGSSKTAKMNISSGSELMASSFQVDICEVVTTSASVAYVYARKQLIAVASSASSITYEGKPEIVNETVSSASAIVAK